MVSAVKRLGDTARAAAAKLKSRSGKWWTALAVVLFVLEEVIRGLFSEWANSALRELGRGVWWLMQQPIGLFGLVFLAYLAILVGVAFWQTRPKPAPTRVRDPPPPLTAEDREAMHDFRVLWNRHGSAPASTLATLFEEVAHRLDHRNGGPYWIELLKPKAYGFRDARLAMDSAVAADSQLTAEEIKARFEGLYSHYLQAVKWLAMMMDAGDLRLDENETRRLDRWKAQHYRFREELLNLHEKPRYKGKLEAFPSIWSREEPYMRLLRSAEEPPADEGAD